MGFQDEARHRTTEGEQINPQISRPLPTEAVEKEEGWGKDLGLEATI
jgi:hypothetical protein